MRNGVLLILVTVLAQQTAEASVKVGATCSLAGKTQKQSGKTFVCSYLNKKLIWRIKPAIQTPPVKVLTWAEIDAIKTAEAAKVAEELRLKLEAEAKAAAELKAKLEAGPRRRSCSTLSMPSWTPYLPLFRYPDTPKPSMTALPLPTP